MLLFFVKRVKIWPLLFRDTLLKWFGSNSDSSQLLDVIRDRSLVAESVDFTCVRLILIVLDSLVKFTAGGLSCSWWAVQGAAASHAEAGVIHSFLIDSLLLWDGSLGLYCSVLLPIWALRHRLHGCDGSGCVNHLLGAALGCVEIRVYRICLPNLVIYALLVLLIGGVLVDLILNCVI